jgi:hypothetical protein
MADQRGKGESVVASVVNPDPRGSASFWEPGSASGSAPASNKNQDPDPHQLHMTSQNVWIKSLFEYFFKGLSLYLEARIRIRIHIRIQ